MLIMNSKKSCSSSEITSEAFQLKGSEEFAARSNSVFEALNPLEKHHVNWQCKEELVSNFDERETAPSHFEDVSVQFKKPRIPVPRKRKLAHGKEPGFQRNPRKWVKYSLADVGDTTDETNTAIAMSFLHDIRSRRHSVTESPDMKPNTVCFNRLSDESETVSKNYSDGDKHKTSSHHLSGVIVMPECVIGEKKARKPKRLQSNEGNEVSKIRLGHIEEHFLEEEEDV